MDELVPLIKVERPNNEILDDKLHPSAPENANLPNRQVRKEYKLGSFMCNWPKKKAPPPRFERGTVGLEVQESSVSPAYRVL